MEIPGTQAQTAGTPPQPLAAKAAAATRDARLDPKLVTAAHQFEASLMQELLKPLSSGQLFGEDDEDGGSAAQGGLSNLTSSGDGSGGALMSFGSEALAKALSEAGGLGIARRILDHFEASSEAAAAGAKRSVAQAKKTENGSGRRFSEVQDGTEIHY